MTDGLQRLVCACCAIFLIQFTRTAPAQGYVVQWGWNAATGAAASAKVVASNCVAVNAGTFHSLALKEEGTVIEWGGNYSSNATGIPTTNLVSYGEVKIGGRRLSNVIAIAAARDHSLALQAGGNVVSWGESQVPAGLSNITAIAAENKCSWVLRRDGTIAGWGGDPTLHEDGQLFPENGLSNIEAIAVGPGGLNVTRRVALRRDGTVGYWGGETDYKDARPPVGLSNVVAIAAGASHSLALKSDGTVIGWGWNKMGEATGTPMAAVPNLAYFSEGRVQIEGRVLSSVVSIAAGRGYSLALKKDGTVVAWGRMVNYLYPAIVPEGLSNVVAIAAGAEDFCLAITTNRQVAARFLPAK